jgi:hypothetical protein
MSRLRTFAALGFAGAAGVYAAERWIASLVAAGEGPDPLIKMAITVDAPIERVWEAVADVERQPIWMLDMKRVRLLTPGPVRVGTRAEADVRIFLVGVVDEIEVDMLEAPWRLGIRHVGRFRGHGRIILEAIDARRTLVRWDEELVPPILPNLGQLLQKPIMGAVFQADLERLKELVESGYAEATAGAGADAG